MLGRGPARATGIIGVTAGRPDRWVGPLGFRPVPSPPHLARGLDRAQSQRLRSRIGLGQRGAGDTPSIASAESLGEERTDSAEWACPSSRTAYSRAGAESGRPPREIGADLGARGLERHARDSPGPCLASALLTDPAPGTAAAHRPCPEKRPSVEKSKSIGWRVSDGPDDGEEIRAIRILIDRPQGVN